MVMRWTPATNKKEVQNMTYEELQKLVEGRTKAILASI